MTRRTILHRSVQVMVTALCIVACAAENQKHPDFGAQIDTVSRMARLAAALSSYRTAHGEYPRDLDVLKAEAKLPPIYVLDGWNKDYYYFRSEGGYVLASFGRGGKPDRQLVNIGWVVQWEHFETDIVVISGEWAQTPYQVDASGL